MAHKHDPEERKRKVDVIFSKLKRMSDKILEDEKKLTSRSEVDTTDVNNFSSGGAPTSPSMDVKPFSPVVNAPENSATCNEAPKAEVQASAKTHSVTTQRKHPRTEKNKGYEVSSLVTSKRGRFDHATINRSESPVNWADAKPSTPYL